MKQTIEIAGFIPCSAADGPGIRSILFLQGCHRNCPGCHNRKLQEPGRGITLPISQVTENLATLCRNKKLTISGGEPMEQADALKELLSLLQSQNFELCLYTSFEARDVPVDILKNLRYLKTGTFLKDRMDPPKPYVGSNNQKMFRVTNRKDGTICLREN